jgi:hypothetical protein
MQDARFRVIIMHHESCITIKDFYDKHTFYL